MLVEEVKVLITLCVYTSAPWRPQEWRHHINNLSPFQGKLAQKRKKQRWRGTSERSGPDHKLRPHGRPSVMFLHIYIYTHSFSGAIKVNYPRGDTSPRKGIRAIYFQALSLAPRDSSVVTAVGSCTPCALTPQEGGVFRRYFVSIVSVTKICIVVHRFLRLYTFLWPCVVGLRVMGLSERCGTLSEHYRTPSYLLKRHKTLTRTQCIQGLM